MVETTLPNGLEPLVQGHIVNFGIFLNFLTFCNWDDSFRFSKKLGLDILGPTYCGISATIRIGREMLCLPYAGFFTRDIEKWLEFNMN